MKKISQQSIIGQLGANLIERIVLQQLKYAWRPLLIFDVGIDGEIEICDPETGEATNAIVRVQAKATTQPFTGETTETFEYLCEQKDLDYWLRGNTPVILIVCRPDTNEAYWVSIRDYFKELSVLKARKVLFNKQRDRFGESCAQTLKQLALPKDTGIYFSPLQKAETLYSNLLKVDSFAPYIFIAETEYRNSGEVWKKFNDMSIKIGPEWILTNKRLFSFYDLEETPFNSICDLGTLERFDTSEWSDTNDDDKKREFVRLINQCLKERNWQLGLRFSKEYGYYYFPATRKLVTRKVQYQSFQQQVSREVFKQYPKKNDPKERAYCRHSAFKGFFIRLDGEWYLEITPTYHFTSNGYEEDVFREERLKGIKRLERNPAVIGQLLMWESFIGKPMRSLFSSEYPLLKFGGLATVDIGNGIPDDIWYYAEEGKEAQNLQASDNQLSYLGL